MKKNEYFIIYHNEGRFSGDTCGGYFVSYKNRFADNYSEIYLQAKQYKTIGQILKRFGLSKKDIQYAIELKKNADIQIQDQLVKKQKFHNILDKQDDVVLNWEKIQIFSQGRVEKIILNGNKKPELSSANKEVYEYISEIVDKAEKELLALRNRIKIISPDLDIVNDPDDVFWN
jgi:hypothetical protein